ncbi:MAG TPA: hypothetical protein VFF13_04735 [archaeon]|nr:hypothetical protein [archaeon]
MKVKTTSFAQGHVTGFFKIYPNGSTGAGFNIEKAMKTNVIVEKNAKNSVQILINGKKENAITSKIVVRKILAKTKQKYKIKIWHETKFPIGYGLGLSGAGALSLSKALNKALQLKLEKKEVVKIAAEADIEAGTGLGDVIAEQFSGVMIGKPPYPSKKIAKIPNNYKYAVFAFFGPLSTKKIIRNSGWKRKINKIGTYCMRALNNERSMRSFIRLCRAFSIETKLASTKVRAVMNEFPESSMAMLGNTAFVLTNKPEATKKKLKKFTKKILIGKISK